MKKPSIIIAAVICLITALAQAQEVYHGESFELNNPLPSNQSIEYKANNYIHLKKGFLSTPQSPNYTLLEIDPYFNPETPYGVESWKPDDCIYQGRLGFYPMDFDINENGAAVISMPLEFPEGINGMTPHLSLNYNSQSGNGILGLGWSLGGMSKISRVPYTYMYDDSCHAVQFSDIDELSLDGVALRKGSKGGAVCYYPEIYDYSIVYPINSNGNINNGFRVLKRDGTVYTYDYKYYLQSQIDTPIEWHLSRVEDPFGNYIEYEYENDRTNGAFYPTAIHYTGHGGQSPEYEIVFEYAQDERSDCPPKYFSRPDSPNNRFGFSRINKLLTGILCKYDNERIIKYGLLYDDLDWEIKTLIHIKKYLFVKEEGEEVCDSVVPTDFRWKATDYQLQYETVADEEGVSAGTNYNSDYEWYQHTAFAARFQHENLSGQQKYEQDIVHLMKRNVAPRKYYLNVFRNNNYIDELGNHYRYNAYDCSSINHSNFGAFNDSRDVLAFMPADTDGDGLNEIVCVSYYAAGRAAVSLIKPDQSEVFQEYVILPSLSCSTIADFSDFLVGDFNGDGLSDLFFMFQNRPQIYMSTYDNPFSEQVATDNNPYDAERKVVMGDFNGDKKDQIVIIGRQSVVNHIYHAHYLRVNQNSNNSGYNLSSHAITGEIPQCFFGSSGVCYRLCSGDFNGDGKSDILLMCSNCWRFYFSKGNGVFSEALINYDCCNDPYLATFESETATPAFMFVTDLDQDGCDDVGVLKVEYIHNNTFKGVFRKDFLIRPDQTDVQVRMIRNVHGQNGPDICIDSIEANTTYYADYNPFVPVLGNHKGIGPNEIMTSKLGYHNTGYNLGVFFRNTGCLDNPPVRAIDKIVTSLGATTEIEYRPVSYQFVQNDGYAREEDEFPENERDLTAILPYYGYMNIAERVLTETEDIGANSNAQKTYRLTRYHFSHPKYHTRGRGFLGFGMLWSRQQGQNRWDDIINYQYYSLNSTHSIMVPDRNVSWHFASSTNHNLVKHRENTFTYNYQTNTSYDHALGQIPNDVFSPYLHDVVTYRNEGSRVGYEKETYWKNGYGNVEQYEHYYGTSGDDFPYYEKKATIYEDYIGSSRWVLGVPKTETLIQRLSESTSNTVVRHTSYENDMATGRHTQKCTEPGDEKQLTEVYGYDGFGNLTSTVVTGSGKTRRDSVVYYENGRFPRATINALGQATTYTYYDAIGKARSVTDPNGLTTSYHYDLFGNLIRTEYPSGVLEDQSMMWVGDFQEQSYHPDTPDFGCPVYFVYSKQSGEREKYVFYDQHNRKLREVSCDMNGRKIYVDYQYHGISGLLHRMSSPYHGATPQFTEYTYDYLGRNTYTSRPDGGSMQYVYSEGKEKIDKFDGQHIELTFNPMGAVRKSESFGGSSHDTEVAFFYYGDGKLWFSTLDNSNYLTNITYYYDINRNLQTVLDPSMGTRTYNFNAFGELVESTTPNDETSYDYDALGRMIQRNGTDGDSYWTYDEDFIGTLTSTIYEPVNGPAVKESFQHDRLGYLIQQTQKVGSEEELVFNYTYNRLGKQSSITYPTGKKVKYHYSGRGFMDLVRDAATGDVLWQANASDRWDNISSFTEGDINVNYDYDPITGLVTDIEATRNNHSVFDQSFHWTTTGNLDYRNDAILDLEEIFGYDGYNRLTSVLTREFMGSQIFSSQSFDYAPNGNIIQKPGVVSFDYGTNASPYAVTGIQPEAGQESLYTYQEITYTSFDKLRTLAQDGKTLSINYDINRQRIKQSFSDGSTTRTKRYFTPLYESVTENGVTKKLHYLTAGTGLFAIFVTQNNGGGTMHYTLKDHQGNLTATICGSDVERLSYDAWGRRRNPVDFGYSNVTHTFDRGYTLHEHYDDFNLINMNGRLYDPIIGRMLSPDIAIQDEHDPQAYNRYSYCFNNPLRFTDPSGYVVRGSSSLFSGFTLLFYENHNRKGVLFNTDESLGLQLPKIEPFGEKEKEAYLAYRKEVFSYDTEEYRAIQAELIRLENAEEVFRIRIGGNATNAAGGGNFIYNKETGEFDVNIADFGDFKIIGKMAHELKHADQYMTGELAFDIRGDGQFGKPVAYDVYDEYDAYKRQSLFDKKTISNDVIRDRYKKLIQTRVSIDNVVFPNSKVQMIELNNYDYRTKNKKIRFIYHGWQNDIK